LLLLLGLCLAEQRVGGGGLFLTVVLVNAHALVGIVSVGAPRAKGDGADLERISGLCLLQHEMKTTFFTAGQIAVDQFRAVGAGVA